MYEIQFAELYDFEFINDTKDVPSIELAEKVGCGRKHINTMRRRFGFRKIRHWNEVELEMLMLLFPVFETRLLAIAFRRSVWAIYTKVRKERQKGSDNYGKVNKHGKCTDNKQFWYEWRNYIIDRWIEWNERGLRQELIDLLWRPASVGVCRSCNVKSECKGSERLPCEMATVRDIIEMKGGRFK